MIQDIKQLFALHKKPIKGFLWLEWAIFMYMLITTVVVMFAYTKAENPESMLWGRLRIAIMMLGLWLVYKLVPCRFTLLTRVLTQFGLLAWWYPDTYEINRMFPNLDHLFAQWEQFLFGFQPSLVFHSAFSSPIIGELMDMGYFAYYPMMVVVVLFYFFKRHDSFLQCSFIIIASFMVYYLIYDFLPVVGPTFYFKAIGIDNASKAIFPSLNDYFNHNTTCLPSPGYTNGIFYNLVENAKEAGERPTAAFPSSHVGISTICMLLVYKAKAWKLLWVLLPLWVFLCLATVYIQAHYAIDTLAGFVSALIFFFVFSQKWFQQEVY